MVNYTLDLDLNSVNTSVATSSASTINSNTHQLFMEGEDEYVFPIWTAWLSSSFLAMLFLIGLPLNGATVIIFWRRKKLRHLVNFLLLLDCLSHIVLILIGIPLQILSIWAETGENLQAVRLVLLISQQVVANFCNLSGVGLTLAIGILRYRRLCWKKKDIFSTINAIKWSVSSAAVAITFTVAHCVLSFVASPPHAALSIYSVKVAIVLIAILAIAFCYLNVAQRVWTSGANYHKVMDDSKFKKSRNVHLRASVHSCIQIILCMITLIPYLYVETIQVFNEQKEMLTRQGGEPSEGLESTPLLEASTSSSSSRSADSLWATTINYTLLILGTPLAYIASCNRFREQFKAFVFGRLPNTYLTNNPTIQQSGSPPEQAHHNHPRRRSSSSNQQPANPMEQNGSNNCPHPSCSNNLSSVQPATTLLGEERGVREVSAIRDAILEDETEILINNNNNSSSSSSAKRKAFKKRSSTQVSLDTRAMSNLVVPASSSSPTASDQSSSDHSRSGHGSTRSSASSFTSHNTTTVGTTSGSSSSSSGCSSMNIVICVPCNPSGYGADLCHQHYLIREAVGQIHNYGENV